MRGLNRAGSNRAVPVAMALMCTSNPELGVLDVLSKLSHDADPEVAYNAIFAMGILGAGTNHARISGMLRHLAQYYSKDPDTLFIVRIAQVRTETLAYPLCVCVCVCAGVSRLYMCVCVRLALSGRSRACFSPARAP